MAGIDTRRLTRILRDKGAQNACLVAAQAGAGIDADAALAAARAFAGLEGMDLAHEVTTAKAYDWHEGVWRLGEDYASVPLERRRLRVVAYDFGVKHNILRILSERGCRVTVVPATTTCEEVLALAPDGVFLSNGPGDPEPCDYAITAIRGLLDAEVPLFGICLGHQLLAIAGGARTTKMKFGHHGANHPVQDLATGNVLITSQNHGFAVDEASLPGNIRATHRSLFDGSLQGVRFTDHPAFGFQGHPEASPGPHDIAPLFEVFVALMDTAKRGERVTGSLGA
jgi:carbamoyl-phosphate synthase small subunit